MYKWIKENIKWIFAGIGTTIVSLTVGFIIINQQGGGKESDHEFRIPSENQKLFNIKTGEIGCREDPNLVIENISYPLEDKCSASLTPPAPINLEKLPVLFDNEEKIWKIRTNKLPDLGILKISELLAVPQKIYITVGGLNANDSVTIHVFTDHQYPLQVKETIIQGKVKSVVNIGVPGFLCYLNLSTIDCPQLPDKPEKNMIHPDLGPIAILIISAQKGNDPPRRSRPYALIRSGIRTPDDVWIINGSVQWAYVDDHLPPLIVFQSAIKCGPPILQGIFAGTLEGAEIYQISPPIDSQSTLIRVVPGPPAIVYFRSNFETYSTRVCYKSILNRGPIKVPVRVDESLCEDLR